MFENYSVYVDRDFKTASITAGIQVSDHNLNEFNNKCRNKKKDLLKKISKLHNISSNKYVDHAYQLTNKNKK